MNRNQKIALLKGVFEGKVTLKQLLEVVPFSCVVIYIPKQDKYRLSGEKEFMSQEKIKQKIKGA